MFSNADRAELLDILRTEYNNARNLIVGNDYIPNSMHRNGDSVGVTIEFRKIYDELVCEQCGITASDLMLEDPLVGIHYNGRMWICSPCDRRMEIED